MFRAVSPDLRAAAQFRNNGATVDMIKGVLPSDVEFARGLINFSHSDAEIVSLLCSRNIEAAEAARLVADLRHGRTPTSQLPYPADATILSDKPKPRPPVPIPSYRPLAPKVRLHRTLRMRGGGSWWILVLLILFAWAFSYAFLHLGSDASRNAIQTGRHELPPAPNK